MKYSRQVPLSSSSSLQLVERHLRKKDLRPCRDENRIEAKLFAWKEFFSETDADRFSWNSVHVEEKDSALHLHFHYNWQLQAFAQVTLSVFTIVLMVRIGNPAAITPVVTGLNAALMIVSLISARIYAQKFASEIAAITP